MIHNSALRKSGLDHSSLGFCLSQCLCMCIYPHGGAWCTVLRRQFSGLWKSQQSGHCRTLGVMIAHDAMPTSIQEHVRRDLCGLFVEHIKDDDGSGMGSGLARIYMYRAPGFLRREVERHRRVIYTGTLRGGLRPTSYIHSTQINRLVGSRMRSWRRRGRPCRTSERISLCSAVPLLVIWQPRAA